MNAGAVAVAGVDALRRLAVSILSDPAREWEWHGFGLLRTRLDSDTRLHVWHKGLMAPGVTLIHDHEQWAFRSVVIGGRLTNRRYEIMDAGEGKRYMRGTIQAGVGGSLDAESVREVWLRPYFLVETYGAGEAYAQQPTEPHLTEATEGTVTLVMQERTGTGAASVFWRYGGVFVPAFPRAATVAERYTGIGAALMELARRGA